MGSIAGCSPSGASAAIDEGQKVLLPALSRAEQARGASGGGLGCAPDSWPADDHHRRICVTQRVPSILAAPAWALERFPSSYGAPLCIIELYRVC